MMVSKFWLMTCDVPPDLARIEACQPDGAKRRIGAKVSSRRHGMTAARHPAIIASGPSKPSRKSDHVQTACRHPRHRTGELHRRSPGRNAARRHGRRRHQGRAAQGRHGARHAAKQKRGKRQFRRPQPQQAQPRAGPEAAAGPGDRAPARGKVRRAARGLSPRRAGQDGARRPGHQSDQSQADLHVGVRLRPDRAGPPPRRRQPDHRGVLRRAVGDRRAGRNADAARRAVGRRVRRDVCRPTPRSRAWWVLRATARAASPTCRWSRPRSPPPPGRPPNISKPARRRSRWATSTASPRRINCSRPQTSATWRSAHRTTGCSPSSCRR